MVTDVSLDDIPQVCVDFARNNRREIIMSATQIEERESIRERFDENSTSLSLEHNQHIGLTESYNSSVDKADLQLFGERNNHELREDAPVSEWNMLSDSRSLFKPPVSSKENVCERVWGLEHVSKDENFEDDMISECSSATIPTTAAHVVADPAAAAATSQYSRRVSEAFKVLAPDRGAVQGDFMSSQTQTQGLSRAPSSSVRSLGCCRVCVCPPV